MNTDLISRSELLRRLQWAYNDGNQAAGHLKKLIKEMPPADTKPQPSLLELINEWHDAITYSKRIVTGEDLCIRRIFERIADELEKR